MDIIEGGLEIKFPKMVKIKQKLPRYQIGDIRETIIGQFNQSKINEQIAPGMSIAVAVGSRGINHLYEIVETVVNELKKRKARPFIVPAMGSHGGATSEGQRNILEGYGISEENLKILVKSSMEVIEIGKSKEGLPIYFDKNAFLADGVVPINRVKVHTDFRGEIESGLLKMLVIGLGKHKGATEIHKLGFENFHWAIPYFGSIVLKKVPIIFGIALIEDAFENIAEIKALIPSEIIDQEKELLKKSKEIMARINIPEIELLIVSEIGKNISGNGLDPNVVGRFRGKQKNDLKAPNIKRIIILDLSEKTHGNAIGIGYADITVKSLVDKIDFPVSYTNAITSGDIYDVKIPLIMNTEKEAIALGVKMINHDYPFQARVVQIRNTLNLEEIMISESIFNEIKHKESFEILVDSLEEMSFDKGGKLIQKI
jgi:3D (Asp-Asp-Asp) domain-containing protein